MNRGVEIDSDVADGPHSVILNQVTNGVAVRMAVLYLLAGELAAARRGGEGRRVSAPRDVLLKGGRLVDPSLAPRRHGRPPRARRQDRERRREHRGAGGRDRHRLRRTGGRAGFHRRALPSARAGPRGRRDDRDRRARRGGRRLHRRLRDAEHRSGHRQPGGGRLRAQAGEGRRARRASIRSARSPSASAANGSRSSARWSAPARSP